jgi:very-short-patch-repair endonuclease
LIIEVDGGQHNEQKAYDNKRSASLRSEGFTILRFWDHEVLTQIDNVKRIYLACVERGPLFSSPPKRGRKRLS